MEGGRRGASGAAALRVARRAAAPGAAAQAIGQQRSLRARCIAHEQELSTVKCMFWNMESLTPGVRPQGRCRSWCAASGAARCRAWCRCASSRPATRWPCAPQRMRPAACPDPILALALLEGLGWGWGPRATSAYASAARRRRACGLALAPIAAGVPVLALAPRPRARALLDGGVHRGSLP